MKQDVAEFLSDAAQNKIINQVRSSHTFFYFSNLKKRNPILDSNALCLHCEKNST